jgi:channel protein (hemolysin III family)
MPEILSVPGFSEPFSSWTHLLGAVVFAVLGVRLLLRHGRGAGRIVALLLFGFSSVFLLSMSGVYHLLDADGAGRDVLRQLDHGAIFVLIAGTITAVHALLFKGPWRWVMIVLAWSICATAVTLKSVFFAELPEWASFSAYIGMGWLGIISILRLWWLRGLGYVALLLSGGLTYTVGALLDFLRLPVLLPGVIGPHELFHVAVLVALGLHWAFIQRVLASQDAPAVEPAGP